MNNLTKKQAQLLECINYFIKKHGYSPTVRELCKLCELSSTATIHVHLKNLVDKGYITYIPNASRTIRVIKEV